MTKKPESLSFINELVSLISLKTPNSYYATVRKAFGDSSNTILDVGCGNGSLMYVLNRDKKYTVTGIDIFAPDLKKAKSLGVYKKLIQGDIQNMKIAPHSYDIVVACHVVEHFKKPESLKLVKAMEKIARKRVIIVTPTGFVEQHAHDNNPYQEHKSGWWPEDFLKRRYTVIGQGWNLFRTNKNFINFCSVIGPFNNFFFLIPIVLKPLFVHKLEQSHQLICIKEIKE